MRRRKGGGAGSIPAALCPRGFGSDRPRARRPGRPPSAARSRPAPTSPPFRVAKGQGVPSTGPGRPLKRSRPLKSGEAAEPASAPPASHQAPARGPALPSAPLHRSTNAGRPNGSTPASDPARARLRLCKQRPCRAGRPGRHVRPAGRGFARRERQGSLGAVSSSPRLANKLGPACGWRGRGRRARPTLPHRRLRGPGGAPGPGAWCGAPQPTAPPSHTRTC